MCIIRIMSDAIKYFFSLKNKNLSINSRLIVSIVGLNTYSGYNNNKKSDL